ncbi:hypothetical protein Tco_0918535 [Tanacetum coccineum]
MSSSSLSIPYREFPSVFCLKINHGGTFTPPHMTRYKGGKVNWVDDIDSDTFSIVEVTSMLQELGYENPCMAYYYKKPNSELENGLVELVVDKDVYEMLMYVDKFKVIELYTDHTVKKQHVLTQEPLATIIDVTQPDSSSGNEAEVDLSEDEWLRESLKKLPIKSKKCQQSSRKEVGQSSRNCNTPKIGSQRNVFSGALLHDPIAQVRRERPLTESFEKKSCKFGLQCTSSMSYIYFT